MTPDTAAVLWFGLAAFLGAPLLTGLYNIVEDRIQGIRERIATDREVDRRMAQPLPVERAELTEWNEPVSPRLHERETELHSQSRALQLPMRQAPIRVEAEASGCNVPCTARHCAEHAGVLGTVAQRRHSRAAEQLHAHLAWTTDTAQWPEVVSLLGLTVPDFPPLRPAVFVDVT